jgi:hypothetical protein
VPQKAAKGGENSNRFEGALERSASIITVGQRRATSPTLSKSVELYATRRPGFGLYARFAKDSPPA